MTAAALSRRTKANSTLSCEGCGEEMQVIGSFADDVEFDFAEAAEQWNRDHARCGEPAEAAAWSALVERGAAVLVQHGGNAEKVMPMPRPSWASKANDQIGGSLGLTCYCSFIASVPATLNTGWVNEDDNEVLYSRINVAAKLYGNGIPVVGVTVVNESPVKHRPVAGLPLTVDEARQLAQVLTAAADLVVSQ